MTCGQQASGSGATGLGYKEVDGSARGEELSGTHIPTVKSEGANVSCRLGKLQGRIVAAAQLSTSDALRRCISMETKSSPHLDDV